MYVFYVIIIIVKRNIKSVGCIVMKAVKRIAFVNGKGGCGKTTSIFHVAGVLAKAG